MTTPSRSQEYALGLGPGTRLVQYEIERVLGQGSFGITYLASEPLLGDLGEKVAIKEFLPCDLAGRATDRDTVVPHTPERRDLFEHGLGKFLEEARRLKLLSRGNPPNIVRVRTAFEANGTAYLVMDYYEGQTLTAYMASGSRSGQAFDTRRLDPEDAVSIIVQVLHGLAAVHDKGFVHRDVKPDNIYLRAGADDTREALLLDFGAARQALLEQKRSADWTVVLSRGYAPPEQYQRSGEQGPWTDIYACAAVLYQLVTGEVPPDGDLRERAAQGFLRGEDAELIPPRQLAPDCPPALEAAIERGLMLDPAARPQTAEEFIALLEGRGEQGPAQQPEPAAPTVVMDSATVVLEDPASHASGATAGRGTGGDAVGARAGASARVAGTSPPKRPRRQVAVLAGLVLFGAIGAAGYLSPWTADAASSDLPSGQEAMLTAPVQPTDQAPLQDTDGATDQERTAGSTDRGGGERPAAATERIGSTSDPVETPPPAADDTRRQESAQVSRPPEPSASAPRAAELRPLSEALTMGNIHLEGARFGQADAVVAEALVGVDRLLSRYPRADTLQALQRALRNLRQENRVNCNALAEVIGGNCPGGG